MSDDEDDSPSTIFLKAPIVKTDETPAEEPVKAARLVCADTSLLDTVPDGGVFALTRSEETIGRGDECTVRIDSSEISRVHARISVYSDRWVIEDAGSRNGTLVNDGQISGKTIVSNGDSVRFGKIPFRFEIGDAPAEQPSDAAAEEEEEISIEMPSADPAPASAAPEEPEEEMILELPGTEPAAAAPEPAPEPEALELPDPAAAPEPAAPAPEPEDIELPEPAAAPEPEPAAPAPAPAAAATPAETPAPPAPEEPPMSPPAESPEVELARTRLSHDPATLPPANLSTLQEQVPQLVSLLLAQARAGDAAAARVCIEYLIHEEQRLPDQVAGTGPVGTTVKKVLAGMLAGDIPPKQALDTFQAIATARNLLKTP